jgi:hypothetical protein
MKFTLTYDGELPACGNSSRKTAEKWAIRKTFHPQLAELMATHPVMKMALKSSVIPAAGAFFLLHTHHSDGGPVEGQRFASPASEDKKNTRNLFEPLAVGGRNFFPIVRESMALVCGLKILFLRKEEPGSLVLQGGDLDNRIKTLFDALRVPAPDEIRPDTDLPDPLYCLLENDSLITGCSIETGRLLSRPGASAHEVRLVIEVDVRVTLALSYNTPFLSD